jgi:ABC-2 type transport system permease protein
MRSIFLKEFNSFLNSLIAYIVIAIFLTAVGLFTWVFPSFNVLDSGYADLNTLFSITPLIYLFLIPAITMRTFAEERKGGTLELIFTKPVSDYDVIFGKWLACWALVFVSLVPTLFYYASIYYLGIPKGNIDTASVIGSYIGLLLVGGAYCSIGIFASTLTDNQIIAFVVAIFLCFFLYQGFDFIAAIDVWGTYAVLISRLGISYNFQGLSKGLVDSRNIIYFISIMAIMLQATKFSLDSRKW